MRPWSGAAGSPVGGGMRSTIASRTCVDVGAVLGRDEDDLLARDGEHVLELLDDHVRLRRGQVDLVDDGDDDEALREREVDVGERLGLDALGGVDDEDGALAGLEAAADLVAEVDVAGRVDEVEPVRQAVARGVLEAHRARLDGDALLALEVHGVEHLARHLARVDGVRQLEDAVGQRGLAVVDVGDDGEVAQARLGDAGHGARASLARVRVRAGTPAGGGRPADLPGSGMKSAYSGDERSRPRPVPRLAAVRVAHPRRGRGPHRRAARAPSRSRQRSRSGRSRPTAPGPVSTGCAACSVSRARNAPRSPIP